MDEKPSKGGSRQLFRLTKEPVGHRMGNSQTRAKGCKEEIPNKAETTPRGVRVGFHDAAEK